MKIILSSVVFITFLISYTFIGCSHTLPEDVNGAEITIKESEDIVFHYEDSFSEAEKVKLETWLKTTVNATEKLLGKYPFKLYLYLHRSENAGEPVPWANTERSEKQGVHFHVNPDYSLEAFLGDWTAPHEISHLAIPFVGRSNSWFAEGFATYMQGEILLEMGECTQKDIDLKYEEKMNNARPYYMVDEPYAEVAMNLRKSHHYPEMYWGGALFFVQLNNVLVEEEQTTLYEVLQDYQLCCRLNDSDLSSVLNSFDSITNSEVASALLDDYRTLPARELFPE
jgi:hypothetical protein